MHEHCCIAATTWFDLKPISFLSMFADLVGLGIALWWINNEKKEISTTPQQVEY